MNTCYYTALGDSLTQSIVTKVFYGFSLRIADYLQSRCDRLIYRNFGVPKSRSRDLLFQLQKSSSVKQAVAAADIITITIGGNDLLQCTYDNYSRIDKKMSSTAVMKFENYWYDILENIRNVLSSSAHIYVMLLYNPYSYNDSIYPIADHYIRQINSILADPYLINAYGYRIVDIYTPFEESGRKDDLLIHKFIKDPHPNRKGFYVMANEFIRRIDAVHL